MIPPRSAFSVETVFPGMATPSGDLMILGVQRGGEYLGLKPVTLEAGDTLLLQGTSAALDQRLADPRVLAVHAPEVVRRQAIPLGHRAAQAQGVLLLGVQTVPQMWKGVDCNTCIIVGGMIPLATAMTQSGLPQQIADGLIVLVGWAGPLAMLAGLFVVTVG